MVDKLSPKEVIVAFDADLEKNEHVKLQRNKLSKLLLNKGYKVMIAKWNIEDGKGLDDLLVNGKELELTLFRPTVDIETTKTQINKIEPKEMSAECRVSSEEKEKDNKVKITVGEGAVQINDYEIAFQAAPPKRIPINELLKIEEQEKVENANCKLQIAKLKEIQQSAISNQQSVCLLMSS